ncbi:MAG: ABC transporter permease [Candidatus Tectomicrobia bacterium]|uniref:ABC transporter permease n=1 Tax=Tectimicrobiota bacterium TaxID=2528274 RepID=A0A932GS59_UNCTE|nr:ABC transporter permease [Candidatus Tectomicrobia bacterium]
MEKQDKALVVPGEAESFDREDAPVRPSRKAASRRKAAWDNSLRIGSIVAIFFIWWILSLIFPPTLIPKPWETLAEAGAIISTGNFFVEIGNTLRRVLVGFGLAMAVSIPLGILMGTLRRMESFFEPPVILGLTMPGLIWAVLMIMFFGLTETSAYAAVAITIFPMLTISIWQGTKSIDKDLIDMSNVFQATPVMKIVEVILPQLISHILAAIRYGLGLAWKVVVVVEMFGFSNGVGYQVVRGFNVFSMKTVLAWALTFLIVMILIEFGLIGWFERSVTRWRPRVEAWRR